VFRIGNIYRFISCFYIVRLRKEMLKVIQKVVEKLHLYTFKDNTHSYTWTKNLDQSDEKTCIESKNPWIETNKENMSYEMYNFIQKIWQFLWVFYSKKYKHFNIHTVLEKCSIRYRQIVNFIFLVSLKDSGLKILLSL